MLGRSVEASYYFRLILSSKSPGSASVYLDIVLLISNRVQLLSISSPTLSLLRVVNSPGKCARLSNLFAILENNRSRTENVAMAAGAMIPVTDIHGLCEGHYDGARNELEPEDSNRIKAFAFRPRMLWIAIVPSRKALLLM